FLTPGNGGERSRSLRGSRFGQSVPGRALRAGTLVGRNVMTAGFGRSSAGWRPGDTWSNTRPEGPNTPLTWPFELPRRRGYLAAQHRCTGIAAVHGPPRTTKLRRAVARLRTVAPAIASHMKSS